MAQTVAPPAILTDREDEIVVAPIGDDIADPEPHAARENIAQSPAGDDDRVDEPVPVLVDDDPETRAVNLAALFARASRAPCAR